MLGAKQHLQHVHMATNTFATCVCIIMIVLYVYFQWFLTPTGVQYMYEVLYCVSTVVHVLYCVSTVVHVYTCTYVPDLHTYLNTSSQCVSTVVHVYTYVYTCTSLI